MIVSGAVENYLQKLQPTSQAVFQEMEQLANKEDFPIIGPQVGRLLAMLAQLQKARSVFELGSGFGYSGLWFAQALPDTATVFLTELEQTNLDLARGFFERAGSIEKARFLQGSALELLRAQTTTFDIIFNDIEKEDYPLVVDVAVDKLNPRGLLITDNALWYGKPADQSNQDTATQGVRAYNERVMNHPELDTVILPLRDGVALSIKHA